LPWFKRSSHDSGTSDRPDDTPEQEPEPELWHNEVRIDAEEVRVGHFIARMDCPWSATPFPLEGVMIKSLEQRAWFVDHCRWVIVDRLRSREAVLPKRNAEAAPEDAAPSQAEADAASSHSSMDVLRRATLDRESIEQSVEGHRILEHCARSLIDAISNGGELDLEAARSGVRQIADTLERNIAAMIWLTRIKNADDHIAEHGVNVAILSMGVAHALKWTPEQVEHAGLAGLLHDLGETRIGRHIVEKPAALTPEEVETLRQHPRLGYEILKDDGSVPKDVLRAVLEHHERPDGKGYPLGRDRSNLQPLGALIGAVDTYDAMTSPRPYRAARSHHAALGALWKGRDSKYDEQMVEALIQFLGWITPGTLVKLSDGEFAVVLQSTNEHRLRPVVRRLVPDHGEFRPGMRLDLARTSSNGEPMRVVEVLPDGALSTDMNRMLQDEASDDAQAFRRG
jgi:putative nucleotidyltransferase with HDIG domain